MRLFIEATSSDGDSTNKTARQAINILRKASIYSAERGITGGRTFIRISPAKAAKATLLLKKAGIEIVGA